MLKAKKYLYIKPFEGIPKEIDFKLVEEELPPLKNGEFLSEAVYLSVDPYQRAKMVNYSPGVTMIGMQVAKITESKHKDFPVGKFVVGNFGWRTHTISDGKPVAPGFPPAYILPDLGNHPPSLGLGILGRPGNSAYFGFLEICKPQSGETVVVSGAAGAVGTLVGQIAKLKGCYVIGIAGTDEKCSWIVNELGFDHALNYKKDDIESKLKEVAPNGIDCYFDNVGGEISSIVIWQMNTNGRIAICGSISSYNSKETPKATIIQRPFLNKSLRMEGFLVNRWTDRWFEGINQLLSWIQEGKLKYQESVTEGFENTYSAFVGMLRGENKGKAVVKL